MQLGTNVVVWAGVCVVLGLGSSFLGSPGDWYLKLKKPWWTPPGWAFGVVWPVLYVLMGVAIAVARSVKIPASNGTQAMHPGVWLATAFFVIQLILNLAWSPVFFGLETVGGGLLVIIALWCMIGMAVAAMWSVSDVAGYLMLPYWAWVTYATALNAAIFLMNF